MFILSRVEERDERDFCFVLYEVHHLRRYQLVFVVTEVEVCVCVFVTTITEEINDNNWSILLPTLVHLCQKERRLYVRALKMRATSRDAPTVDFCTRNLIHYDS